MIAANSKVGKSMLGIFVFQTHHSFLHKKHLLWYAHAIFWKNKFVEI